MIAEQEERPADWSVERIRTGASRDEVRAIVGRHNCGWAVDVVRDVQPMTIRSRWIEELCITKMQFANIRGERGRDLIANDDRAYMGFTFLQDGCATLNGGAAFTLERGQILLWSSLRAIDFQIDDHATFFNIMIPEDNIRHLTGRKLLDPIVVSQKSGSANFAFSHLASLMNMPSSNERFQEAYIANATNYIFSNFISSIEADFQKYSYKYKILLDIIKFIDKNIKNSELSPQAISDNFHFSVRYLHKMFEAMGVTVMDYIRTARLNGARNDLANPLLKQFSVTEICFKWGFNDASHFSRLFHAQFGISARSWREEKLSPHCRPVPRLPPKPLACAAPQRGSKIPA